MLGRVANPVTLAAISLILGAGGLSGQTRSPHTETAKRSAILLERREVPADVLKAALDDPIDWSMTVPLIKGYTNLVVPDFLANDSTRITVTTETGQSQEWRGVANSSAKTWALRGYDSVNVLIERKVGAGWEGCPIAIHRRRPPSPDRTRRLVGTCVGSPAPQGQVYLIPR